ncbi:MAG: hypothetical protein EBV98_05345 [Actinobacteria bacterium]|nr:hypothetical protein [Actinomycetota bacterium]
MKQEKLRDRGLKANFFGYVSQDVSQLNITVIHRRERDTGSAGGSVNLQRVLFSQRLKDGRYRADDPGRGLPGIGYFQTDALAAEKIMPIGSFICALFSEVFKSLGHALYRKSPKSSDQSSSYARSKTGAELND